MLLKPSDNHIVNDEGLLVASVGGSDFGRDDRATHRDQLIASWNACRGLNPKALDEGLIDRMIGFIENLSVQGLDPADFELVGQLRNDISWAKKD